MQLVILVLQVAQLKKTTMMNVTLIVMVSKLITQKENYDDKLHPSSLFYKLHNKKNHDEEHHTHHLGFRACNTKKNLNDKLHLSSSSWFYK
jgi:hypothetical protein